MMTYFRLTALSRLFPTIGSQIITEAGSTEDSPGFEIGKLSIWSKITALARDATFIFGEPF